MVSFITFTLTLGGCPASTEMKLRNETSKEIEVLSAYGDEIWASIPPGRTETVTFSRDCIRIKQATVTYEFEPILVPEEYVEIGLLSTSIRTIFTSTGEFAAVLKHDEPGPEPVWFPKRCKSRKWEQSS